MIKLIKCQWHFAEIVITFISIFDFPAKAALPVPASDQLNSGTL